MKLNSLQSEIGKFRQEIASMKKNKSKNKGNHNLERLDSFLNNFGEQYEHLKVIFINYTYIEGNVYWRKSREEKETNS